MAMACGRDETSPNNSDPSSTDLSSLLCASADGNAISASIASRVRGNPQVGSCVEAAVALPDKQPAGPLPMRAPMYCRVLACDFDGTIADDGSLAPEVSAALADARTRGISVILVTGRVLEDLRLAGVDLNAFDAVVAENGAVVWFSGRDSRLAIGSPPPDRLLAELRARGIPFHVGSIVVGLSDNHAPLVLELVRSLGLDYQLVFNRRALMLLPSGVSKATGVRRALEELGRSEHNMIAFGDAENDVSLLAVAQIGVAARGSVPALTAVADDRLTQAGGAGVVQYVRRLMERGGFAESPPRSAITIGQDVGGLATKLPGTGVNIMIAGDPRAGKSWLAGLLAERLLDARYRLFVIDPEGDHIALGTRPGMLVLGHTLPLPPPKVLPEMLRGASCLSFVLSLAALSHPQKLAYVDEALCALHMARTATGVPHWIVIDEAHYFCHAASPCTCARQFETGTGNFLFVTYRPSLVAGSIHDRVGAYVVAPITIEEERYFMTGLLRSRVSDGGPPHDALAELNQQRVGLLRLDGDRRDWRVFTPGSRVSAHAHHGRKYADARVSDQRAFHFLNGAGQTTVAAHNLVEFCGAVSSVGKDSLRHHLLHGDFSRWIGEVLGDADLAAGLRKLEETTRAGATSTHDEILAHVRDRYFI